MSGTYVWILCTVVGTFQMSTCFSDEEANFPPAYNPKDQTTVFREYLPHAGHCSKPLNVLLSSLIIIKTLLLSPLCRQRNWALEMISDLTGSGGGLTAGKWWNRNLVLRKSDFRESITMGKKHIWMFKSSWGMVRKFLYLVANYCLILIDIYNVVMAYL